MDLYLEEAPSNDNDGSVLAEQVRVVTDLSFATSVSWRGKA